MGLITILILLPIVAGLGVMAVRPDKIRSALVILTVTLLAIGTVAMASFYFGQDQAVFPVSSHAVGLGMSIIEVLIALYLVKVGLQSKHPLIALLAVAQTALLVWFEFKSGAHPEVHRDLMVDKLSIVMALIISLVGGAICIYATGYMKEFHEQHHPEMKDRRPMFFAILLIFLGAMNGVVFSNNLLWLYFFWEITTLCSFLLIGYKQNEESKNNALRALVMNLGGGLAFILGIVVFHTHTQSIELDKLVATRSALMLAPVALLCLAGITKSAQLPFSSWLLGAMVAPTPVSALLHSAAMVKAGVYLIIRMAPVLQGTKVGLFLALLGSVTFLIGSFAAIGASDAKKVLAWSTIANLGLIVVCGGIGTAEAVWAGILLIIFHAIAKALLFLCVGVVEHKLHSRNIEAMSGLILSMPRISVMLQIGMAGMFLAPFGMLISKWAVLKACVDTHPLLIIFIAFGSAATLFFWVKWMGKLLEVVKTHTNVEKSVGKSEWLALTTLAVMTSLTCVLFPLISTALIEPYLQQQYGQVVRMDHGNLLIMLIMLAMVALFPLSFLNYGRRVKVINAYLGGGNVDESSVLFQGVAGQVQTLQMNNYYLSAQLSEAFLMRVGIGISLFIMGALAAIIAL